MYATKRERQHLKQFQNMILVPTLVYKTQVNLLNVYVDTNVTT